MAARKRSTRKQAAFVGNSKAAKLAVSRAMGASKALAVFALTIMLVSLQHLATGFTVFTGNHIAEGIILALAVDGGLIVAEMALAFFGPFLPAARPLSWAIIGMVTPLSMFMNYHGFAHAGQSPTLALILGIGLPLLIVTFAKLASTLYIAAANRTA
jgi:hypothetical protein